MGTNKSKKIFLIYTSNRKLFPFFPASSLALASSLLKAGYEPIIVDSELEDWRKYDYSQALCVCISTFTCQWLKRALAISKEIKAKFPDMKIFWGGPHAVALPEVTAEHELADAVCYTEGEQVVVDLANALYEGKTDFAHIKGIVYKNSKGEIIKTPLPEFMNMDAVDFPPYHLLNLNLYKIKSGIVYYQTSRGCPYGCKFCRYEDFDKWRAMSPEKVISDFQKIAELFNPETVHIFDGEFFIDIARVRKILRMKVDKKIGFQWAASCRFDNFARLTNDDLILLKQSGCKELKFGGESGSENVLKSINKKTQPWQIVEGVRRCSQHGIAPTLSFMMGFPSETTEDLDQTISLIDKLRKDYPKTDINGLFMLEHMPNTPLTNEILKKYNIDYPNTLDEWAEYSLFWTKRSAYPWLTDKEYSYRKTLEAIVSYIYMVNVLLRLSENTRKNTVLSSKILFSIFKLIDRVIRKTSIKLRWEKRIGFFPIEWRIWNLIREYVLEAI